MPHFFIYAKDKKTEQVESVNCSLVNKFDSKIKNARINCRSIGLNKIDYKILVDNPDIECKIVFEKNGKINPNLSDPMIVKYCELNQKYHFKINMECADNLASNLLSKSAIRQELYYQKIAKEIRYELSQFGYSESEIADILVKFLYYVKPSKHKSVLWFCYGKYIFENIKRHIKQNTKIIQCIDCGEWFEVGTKDTRTCRCENCYYEHRRKKKTETMRKLRENNSCGQTKTVL